MAGVYTTMMSTWMLPTASRTTVAAAEPAVDLREFFVARGLGHMERLHVLVGPHASEWVSSTCETMYPPDGEGVIS